MLGSGFYSLVSILPVRLPRPDDCTYSLSRRRYISPLTTLTIGSRVPCWDARRSYREGRLLCPCFVFLSSRFRQRAFVFEFGLLDAYDVMRSPACHCEMDGPHAAPCSRETGPATSRRRYRRLTL